MRTHKIITIDLGADAQRRKYEPVLDFQRRVDETISDKINAEQNALGEDWYLLSIVPTDNTFSPGTYLTTWEFDDSDTKDDVLENSIMDEASRFVTHETDTGFGIAYVTTDRGEQNVKTLGEISKNVKDRLETEFGVSRHPKGYIKSLTGNGEYGQSEEKHSGEDYCVNEDSVPQDGDNSPHIQHGEAIRVNGVRFICTSFQRDNGGANVEFMEESEYRELFTARAEPGYTFIQAQAAANRGQRLGGPLYGTRTRTSYNQPRGYRG